MASQSTVQKLVELLKHEQITTYFDVASLTVLIYDYLLTIEAERSLIWTMPWSIVKILFFLARYLPFIDTPLVIWHQMGLAMTDHQCQAAYKISGWLEIFGMMLAELILVLRAWAIWERKKVMGILLCAWTMVLYVSVVTLMAKFLDSLKFAPFPHGITGCLVVGGSSVLAVNWTLLMIYEAGILLIMLIVGFRTYRLHGNSPLFKAVYGDGSLFYLYLFALSVANVVVIRTLPADFLNTLTSIERVLHSIFACRLVLNLRRVGRQPIVGSNMHVQALEMNTFSIDLRGREAYVSQGLGSVTYVEQTS